MGAYFSVRSARRTRALPLIDPVFPKDPRETLTSGKVMAKALAGSYEAAGREAVARAFTSSVVDAYWSSIQKPEQMFALPNRLEQMPEADLPFPALSLARDMGNAAGAIEPLAAAYLISGTYTAMLPDECRSRLGAYYTPPPLAERLVSMATEAGVNWTTCRILDPACGGGAFLSAVAQPLVKAASHLGASQIIDEIAHRLKGFEVDPYAAWLSQVFLEATLMPVCQRAGRRLPVVVEVCDSLGKTEPADKSAQYDLVIGNPPYGKISLSPGLRERYRRSLYGHANLYGVFTDLAIRFSRNGGVIAYVTPTSFLAGEYFKALRSLLSSSARPINIDFVSVRKGVFEDALQETMLATYRKTGLQGKLPTVHFIAPTEADGITVEKGGAFEVGSGGGPWLVPRTPDQARIVAALRAMPHRLKDYGYEVSTGPLVWNRHKRQLTSRPGRNTYPLIWAESVTADGRFLFRAEKKNHAPYFKVEDGDEWLVTRRPCVLLQRTTAKEQSRRLIAAELPPAFLAEHGAVVIENHINMIRPIASSPAVSAAVLAAMLNSGPLDRAFRCISGSVAVSAYELESLPLPPPSVLKRLLGRSTTPSAIEKACVELYGIESGM